jgi:transcriptional regulator CtsR|tara:strand:- start:10 stop:1113 length:1104 start_codon:yes stop_codon:yes gene_type:complete
MKKFLGILILGLILCTKSFAVDVTEQLLKLEGMYQRGSITEDEFLKAKSILLKIDLTNREKIEKIKKDLDKAKKLEFIVRQFEASVGGVHFEKMEMVFGDYRLYTHRPGGVKIRRISDNKQLVVLSEKFKIQYYNDGEDIFDFKLDKENQKISMELNGVKILLWEGRYVKRHRAHFFQILVLDEQPFHFYIRLDDNNHAVALNMAKFTRKIDLAVARVKIELAAKFKITPEQIELILKRRNEKITGELDRIVQEKKDEIIQQSSEEVIEASINQALAKELEATIGETMADEFIAAIEQASGEAIDSAISSELASAIDQAIAEAVTEGISAAAAAAGIEAGLAVLAAGGSMEEAEAACNAAAGIESGC